MSYSDWRTRAIRSVANRNIRDFLGDYRIGRPTVLLIPGGMGSQLDRSIEAYAEGRMPPSDYDPVWIDFGILFDGEARTLRIEDSGRDRDDHVIVADGPLRFFLIKPYDATAQFFRHPDINVNYIVFGYDWRRPLAESAALLEEFLKRLRMRVLTRFREDPLPKLTLLAHSQGGLVAKLFLHRIVDVGAWIKQMITVATPYYGTWSQQQRYYVGESLLKKLNYAPSEMAPIIGTLPGPYNLMFLPKATFSTYGEKLKLERYPIRNADGDDGADPYELTDMEQRYPHWVSRQHLRDGQRICKTLSAELPPAVAQRVHNIRSGADNKTPVELVWHQLPRDFDPDEHESPVEKGDVGLGDGTVPAWSAFHASVKEENRHHLASALDHPFLLEDPQVLGIADALIHERPIKEADTAPKAAPTPATVASKQEVESLCQDIAKSVAGRDDRRLRESSMLRGIYRELAR